MPVGLLVRSEGGERVRAVRVGLGVRLERAVVMAVPQRPVAPTMAMREIWFGEMVVVMVKQCVCTY